MATFSAVQAQHIRQAIEEFDSRGREAFLGVYGFDPSDGYMVLQDGRRYDALAIVGVAHRYATGRLASAAEFHDGLGAVAALLRRRGFEVSEPAGASPAPREVPVRAARRTTSAPRSTAPRAAASRRAPAATDRPVAMCPTCFVALPATGVCDQCG